jgi:hypothetical protein
MNASYGTTIIAGIVAAVSLGTLSYSMMRPQPPTAPIVAETTKSDRDPIRIIPLPTRPIQIERVAPFFEPPAPLPNPKPLPKVAAKEEPAELEPDPNPSRRHWHWHEPSICARHGGHRVETHHGKSWRCAFR